MCSLTDAVSFNSGSFIMTGPLIARGCSAWRLDMIFYYKWNYILINHNLEEIRESLGLLKVYSYLLRKKDL